VNSVAAPRLAVVAVAVGCALLVLRPLLLETTMPAVPTLIVVFAGLLAAGALWPGSATNESGPVVGIVMIGVLAFVGARILGGGHSPHAALPRLILLNSFAAVAEEAFFRRLLYRLLEPHGPAYAIGATAALFAVVHVTVYGAWVLPIDLAAGLVLSWQRWASGTWRVPAVTHVVANLLVVI
jgi:membrane protease YdiL (CAAX protease family)